jgi:MFS superfamily sulfate permease-like transporter
MPQGLPVFRWPAVSLDELGPLLAAAVAIAMMSFAETSVLARTFALRAGEETDDNQELIALGAANVAAGLFLGFAVSSSASRTPVAEAAGALDAAHWGGGRGVHRSAPGLRARVAAPPAPCRARRGGDRGLPGAGRGVRGGPTVSLRPGEFALSVVCFLGVALLGVATGIFMAIGLALLAFMWRAWRP